MKIHALDNETKRSSVRSAANSTLIGLRVVVLIGLAVFFYYAGGLEGVLGLVTFAVSFYTLLGTGNYLRRIFQKSATPPAFKNRQEEYASVRKLVFGRVTFALTMFCFFVIAHSYMFGGDGFTRLAYWQGGIAVAVMLYSGINMSFAIGLGIPGWTRFTDLRPKRFPFI